MNCVNQHLKKKEGNCIKACLKSQIFTRQSLKIKMEIVFAKKNVKWTLQQRQKLKQSSQWDSLQIDIDRFCLR